MTPATVDSWSPGQEQVDVGDAPVRLAARAGQVVLPNSSDETFARVSPDPVSWSALLAGVGTIVDPQARAVVWATGFDLVGQATLVPAALVAAALEQLPREPLPSIWEPVVERLLGTTLPRHLDPADLPAAREALTQVADRTTTPALRLAARRLAVSCTADVDRLSAMLADDPDPDLAWRVLVRLAERGAVDADRIERAEAHQPSEQSRTGAARALAALPTAEAKERAWGVFSADDVDNRVFHAVGLGLWTPEQAALAEPYVERYLAEAPTWAAHRGQGFSRTIGGVFPLHAVSETTRDLLRRALDGAVPTVLRRAWNDRLDDLGRDLLVRRARRTSR